MRGDTRPASTARATAFTFHHARSGRASVANVCYARYNSKTMARTSTKSSLKSALKAALIETIEENRGLVRELFQEALEDVALKKAIREGLRTRKVTKGTVLSALARGR